MTPPADRTDAARTGTVALLDRFAAQAAGCDLPVPPTLAEYRAKLAGNAYQVLVAGEAKRGKSTFVNALIGRDVLPTDVAVATSQVFRVRHAAAEAYRVRFEDDSALDVTAADLPRYGSQVVEDAGTAARPDKLIRWIEADVPARFLPPGVSLLDTPGLGALFAAHAEITHRFVPHADAVVFVLDSERPIGQDELGFVETILGVTPDVFFIQTKIDLFRQAEWDAVRRRSEVLLRERFGDRLTDPRVWPISGTNLRKAAATGDDDFLMVSRHRELAAALRGFLFRVAGWGRSARAVAAAAAYQVDAGRTLAARHAVLADESRAAQVELEGKLRDRRRQFDDDWGERGRKRQELLAGVRKVAALGRGRVRQALQPGGPIEAGFAARVTAAASMNDLRRLAKGLAEEAAVAACTEWHSVRTRAREQCLELLAPLAADVESLLGEVSEPAGPTVGVAGPELKHDWLTVVKAAVGSVGIGAMLGGLAASAAAIPAAPLALIGGGLFFRHAWYTIQATQLRAARGEVQRHLTDLLRTLREWLFDVDQASGRFSTVDEHFDSLERAVAGQVGEVAARKSAELRAEAERMAADARLGDEERNAKAERLREQMAEWDRLKPAVLELAAALKGLDRPSAGAA